MAKMSLTKLRNAEPGVISTIKMENGEFAGEQYYPALYWDDADEIMLTERNEEEPRPRRSHDLARRAAVRIQADALKRWKDV